MKKKIVSSTGNDVFPRPNVRRHDENTVGKKPPVSTSCGRLLWQCSTTLSCSMHSHTVTLLGRSAYDGCPRLPAVAYIGTARPRWPCRRGRLLLTRSSALVYADVGRPHRLRIGRTVVPGRSASAKVAPSFSRSLASAHVVSCRHCPGCLCSLRQCHCPLRLRFTARAAITQDAHRAVLLRLCIFSRPSSSSYCACARAPAVVPCLCLCSRSLCCACRPGCCRCVDRLSYCCACASSRGRRDILVQEEN